MSFTDDSLPFKSRYDVIVRRLQSMLGDPGLGSNQRDISIFLDDMLLRLRLWAADIQVDEGSLDWVENIEPVAAVLRDLLHQLDKEVQMFDACTKPLSHSNEEEQKLYNEASKSKGELPKVDKEGLMNAIENLTTYTTPIKAVNSVPKAERTNPKSLQINQTFSSQSIPRTPKHGGKATYFILAHPLPGAMAEQLLGALVLDIHHPLPIPEDGTQRSQIAIEWVHTSTQENVSIYAEWIKSKSIDFQVGAGVSAGLTAAAGGDLPVRLATDVSVSSSYSSSSSSRHDIGPTKITTKFLNPPDRYVNWLVHEYQHLLGKKPIFSRTCYIVTGVKTASFANSSNVTSGTHRTSETLFAARFNKLTWNIRPPWSSKQITQKTYSKGAMF